MSLPSRFAAVAAFLVLTLAGVPWFITASGRSDLYYTLTSGALLSIASGGVWLTFYIGRINIGQGAYALMGGYVSAILVVNYGVSFWLTLPLAGIFCAGASILIGLPILRLRGVYFAMVSLVLTEVARLLALAVPITNGAKGMVSIPLPGAIGLCDHLRDLVLPRGHRRRHVHGDLAVDLPVQLHGHRFRQLHAELLPRRTRSRLRPDYRHLRPLLRLGLPVPDR